MVRRYGNDEAAGEKNVLLYVSPGSVRYDAEDIDLLLPWLPELRRGVGPHDPHATAGGGRSGTKDHAHYEAWCAVGAEIDRRLAMTGLAGYLVEDYYCNDEFDGLGREEKLWKMHLRRELSTQEIWQHIKSVVSYISSGNCPRWLHCIDCPKYKTCRRKKRRGISYKDWTGHRREKRR